MCTWKGIGFSDEEAAELGPEGGLLKEGVGAVEGREEDVFVFLCC